ncbi:MAG TPA: hypothetical protein VHM64_22660 [Candidatus Binatia bacterium]|nr:hypothetical protein [Candidatus Binatia bacterium]
MSSVKALYVFNRLLGLESCASIVEYLAAHVQCAGKNAVYNRKNLSDYFVGPDPLRNSTFGM